MSLTVTSSAFAQGQPIPKQYTCSGSDLSPPLAIAGLPNGTKGLALILDDPDAPGGTWTHWTLWDLPPTRTNLVTGANITSLGGVEGTTSAKSVGYHGPCPPSGTHRYFVHVWALKETLGLPRGASVAELRKALDAKALAQGQLMGTFSR